MKYRIVEGSAGCMLHPPGHAHHRYHVAGFGSKLSLTTALESEELDESLIRDIQTRLDENPGVVTEEWVHSVYNYFRHAYSPDGIDNNTSVCVFNRDHTRPPDHHLAVMHIRSFFPDHEPDLTLIRQNGPLGTWSTEKTETEG